MPLTVLSDGDIQLLLEKLRADELEDFCTSLKEALHGYSNGQEGVVDSTFHQPERTSVHVPGTGTTTLYMPSCSPIGKSIKGQGRVVQHDSMSWLCPKSAC